MEPWKRKEVIGNATLYLGDCLEILPTLEKVDAMQLACSRIDDRDNAIRYFCGIAWKMVRAKEPRHAN